MRRATVLLLFALLIGCRYRFTPGIYVPLQVGTMYRYTSRLVINGRYESPKGRYYTPDTIYILDDTVFSGYDARKVYVKKQYECKEDLYCNPHNPSPDCYCTADTILYYLHHDTLTVVSRPLSFLPPRFRVVLDGRMHIVETQVAEGEKAFPILYTLANPGERWMVDEGNATIRVYPERFDTTSDSITTYRISYRISAKVEGFEPTETSYGTFPTCAKVRYDLTIWGVGLPDITLHAMDIWWCDGVGQVKYLYSPEAASYKDSTLTYLELSFIERR